MFCFFGELRPFIVFSDSDYFVLTLKSFLQLEYSRIYFLRVVESFDLFIR